MVPFHMLGMVSYRCAIVTLSVRRTAFEIFDFKNALTLKTGKGSVKVIENVTIWYKAYDYGSILRRFWDIQRLKHCDLEIRVRGHWKW